MSRLGETLFFAHIAEPKICRRSIKIRSKTFEFIYWILINLQLHFFVFFLLIIIVHATLEQFFVYVLNETKLFKNCKTTKPNSLQVFLSDYIEHNARMEDRKTVTQRKTKN